MYTLEELKELLKERVDPDTLVDALSLSTEEIVEAFEDRIMERVPKMIELVED